MEKLEKLLAPVEVAYVLNLQTATVQQYCREGKINAKKVGTMWRITHEEVRRYIEEGPLQVEEIDNV